MLKKGDLPGGVLCAGGVGVRPAKFKKWGGGGVGFVKNRDRLSVIVIIVGGGVFFVFGGVGGGWGRRGWGLIGFGWVSVGHKKAARRRLICLAGSVTVARLVAPP